MNLITVGINAVIEHINNHAQVSPEVTEAEAALRTDLTKLNKKELIDIIVGLKIKKTTKVVQADLVKDILSDPRCAILTYEEISETILENLDTEMKFSVANITWYKTNLQTRKGVEGLLNRMPAKERAAYTRQLLKQIA